MKLESAIKILENWVEIDRKMRDFTEPVSDFDRFCEERNVAVKIVLEEVRKNARI